MYDFYKGKKVLITGHTGFKGSWLSYILFLAGADVIGFSLEPITESSLFNIFNIKEKTESIIGDIRNLSTLSKVIEEHKPEIVFHLAAQPIVKESYINPVCTYETNVIGTVNLLESIRKCESVRSVINVTTDKVYKNNEWNWPYRENDELNGFDPYSNSKSCSELVTSSYKNSFFKDRTNISISTVRAGNVIGGGDFSENRIIPDCVRAAIKNENIIVRNPNSIRPYQHVFEALSAYLLLAEKQYCNKSIEGAYNIGPKEEDCVTTGELAEMFCNSWGGNVKWVNKSEKNPKHEANLLKLDSSKIKATIGWKPKLNIKQAIDLTTGWYKEYYFKNKITEISEKQIMEYINL